eukprot:gene19396-23220_t
MFKSLPFDQIYDRYGLRIITETTNDCFAVSSIVHGNYKT